MIRRRRPWPMLALVLSVAAAGTARAQEATVETLEQAICRMIETAARRHDLPVHFFTRLIWTESRFRIRAVSPAGAQGVAQFMPGTARERGLADPFDPQEAIAHSASLLADLKRQFGNLGLAAAAYNGGPNRVQSFLDGRGGLPLETQNYVLQITARTAEDWAAERRTSAPAGEMHDQPPQSCLNVTALLRRPGEALAGVDGPFAPWGVQLAGNFSRAVALASYGRARRQLGAVLGDARPMILGARLRSRGRAVFWRIRVPAQTRGAADGLCNRIRAAGGACAVLRTTSRG